jgi:hypothetical protein
MAKKNTNADHLPKWKPGQSGNPNGRPRNAVSTILKELGDQQEIEFDITLTDKDGNEKNSKGKITAGEGSTINTMLAVKLMHMAMQGNLRAMTELLDRTEGKPRMSIEHSGEITQNTIPPVKIDGRPHATKRTTKGDS